ncbi:hypothetical protein BOX15_Mlig028737g1, partial [Macrostomum lignano]
HGWLRTVSLNSPVAAAHQMASSPTAAELAAADAERREIVARYDAGPNRAGREQDEAPDPEYSPNQLDHFGFYHRSGIPAEVLAAEDRIKQADGKREAKWRKMLAPSNQAGAGAASRFSRWHKVCSKNAAGELTFSLKFARRVYKGIPEKYRYPVWYELLCIDDARKQSPVAYSEVLQFARLRSPDVRQIDLDVNRTYRNTDFYRVRYNPRQRVLFNVLVAYSMYNIDVGYCQGMSQLAAFLLLYFNDEEETFFALSQLFTDKRHAMHGLFIPSFPKLYRYIELYQQCLKKFLSRVDKHVHVKHAVPVTAYTVKWFMQVFLDCVPFSLAIRIWDVFMAIGEPAVVGMAFNLMRLHSRRILRLRSDEDLLHYFGQVLPSDYSFSEDEVLDGLRDCLADMRAASLLPGLSREAELPRTPFSFEPGHRLDDSVVEQRRASQNNVESMMRRSLQRRLSPSAASAASANGGNDLVVSTGSNGVATGDQSETASAQQPVATDSTVVVTAF